MTTTTKKRPLIDEGVVYALTVGGGSKQISFPIGKKMSSQESAYTHLRKQNSGLVYQYLNDFYVATVDTAIIEQLSMNQELSILGRKHNNV